MEKIKLTRIRTTKYRKSKTYKDRLKNLSFILKMTIFAIPNLDKPKEPSFTWIKDETIEYIKELPNPED